MTVMQNRRRVKGTMMIDMRIAHDHHDIIDITRARQRLLATAR